MNIFAISDLHLSFGSSKPMEIFGDKWVNHFDKIWSNWISLIKNDDYVLLCGDLSWGMNLKEAIDDLKWINSLPGKKIIIKGNHDFWWTGIKKLNSLFPDIKFIQNNYFPIKDYAICGSRGFNIDKSENQSKEDHIKILKREQIRMELSLNSAIKGGYKKIIYMMHYPPFTLNEDAEHKNIFIDILSKYTIKKVIYGHIHSNFDKFPNRVINNIEYYLTSCDYLNFIPLKIL